MTAPAYLCPSCGEPLKLGFEIDRVRLHCSNGRCASTACNDGGTGATLAEAMKALETVWEDEGH